MFVMHGCEFDAGTYATDWPSRSGLVDPLFQHTRSGLAPKVYEKRHHEQQDEQRDNEHLVLPPAAAVPKWTAALVARDGLEAMVAAILKSSPPDRVLAVTEALCNQRLGIEPMIDGDNAQVNSIHEDSKRHGVRWDSQ